MLPEILPPMSSYYNIGHPVLVSRIPKISSFNPHMTFYSLCYRGFDVNKPEVFTENHSERHWREQVNKYRQLWETELSWCQEKFWETLSEKKETKIVLVLLCLGL